MQAARGASLRRVHGASTRAEPGHRRAIVVFGAVALLAYAVDVVTKVVAVARIEPGQNIPVVGDVLRLTMVRNPGAAFSTGTELTVLLSCVAILAAVVVLVLARRLADRVWALGLGLLLGGVLGNLTDRLLRAPGPMRGEVVDFLRLPSWPVFNVADLCINVAAGLIIVQTFRGRRLDGRSHNEVDAEEQRAGADRPADGSPDGRSDDQAEGRA